MSKLLESLRKIITAPKLWVWSPKLVARGAQWKHKACSSAHTIQVEATDELNDYGQALLELNCVKTWLEQ
ncbi:hypothetical protein quinque_003769 [Culex quinquefasciatus]